MVIVSRPGAGGLIAAQAAAAAEPDGVPGFVVISWNALYGPKGIPEQAVKVLGDVATEILQEPDVKAKFKEIGFDASPLAAGPLDGRMRSEIERWAHVIAEAGLEKQ